MTDGYPRALDTGPERTTEEDRAAAIGAILFVARVPVPIGVLATQLGCGAGSVRAALPVLREAAANVGLMVQDCGDDSVHLVTAPHLAAILQRFLGLERTVRLSHAAIETLSIVAYRQPITRAAVEAIRGVDSSGVLQTLLARELIEPVGRAPGPGAPIEYATTRHFLEFFGLASLDELPQLGEFAAAETNASPPERDAEAD